MGKVKKRSSVTKRQPAQKRKRDRAPSGASRRFSVRPLDPIAKCGHRTTVEQLFRVDERVDGALKVHLVFLDRRGWYCEHGRNCPAVSPARAIGDSARSNGPHTNGRMRA